MRLAIPAKAATPSDVSKAVMAEIMAAIIKARGSINPKTTALAPTPTDSVTLTLSPTAKYA